MSELAKAFGTDSLQIVEGLITREQAIIFSGELLVQSGRASADYIFSMLKAVEDYGPYIVIAPGIALAHGKPGNDVFETGLSLLLLREPVEFKHLQNDPVALVFGLAAKDHDSHISLMASLAEFLSDEKNIESLIGAPDLDAIRSCIS
jgi:PTS system ascorbate-specific IIA component